MEKIKRHLFWVLPSLIFLTATAFRTYKLFILPAGLFPDEAANGLDINLMEQGHLQPFYERGNGREALFFYMLWGSVKIFGRSPFAHHLVSALVGTLAVAACYFVTKEIFRLKAHSSRLTAYLAAFLMAVSSWHVVLSRTAFRANLIPLLSALTLWAMLKIVTRDKQKVTSKQNPAAKSLFAIRYSLFPILFGIFFALGFYTYIAFRIMIPLVGILILSPTAAFLQ
jgi:4-amino-4-deoxy-L-arabinose transferase-like glycosyltransferase